jgi:hypothetical protein
VKHILVSGQGQADNLGDSVLRRGLLDALRPHGRLAVNVSDLPSTYISGLGLQPEDLVVRTRADWQRGLARSMARACVYAYNSGEAQLTGRYALNYGRLVPLLALNRARGGAAVHLGFGLRADDRRWAPVVKATLAACDLVTWRDEDSRRWVGLGRTQPDWAYSFTRPAAGVDASGERGTLAVSLRFDRPAPGVVWVDVLRAVAREANLEVLAVPQVERDVPRARDLAAALGGKMLDWHGRDHAENEARVRVAYQGAKVVVSDRLHALIMGHTEGAVPVAFASGPVGKLRRTLATVGVHDVSFREREVDVAQGVDRFAAILDRQPELVARAQRAREGLEAVSAEVGELLATRS